MKYAQKKKFSQYRHCVQLFCRTVLILSKTLPTHEIHLIAFKCEHFQQKIWKDTSFLHQNYTKGSLSKFKFKNSKISLALLRRFLVVKTEILVPVACLRCLRSFQAAMKRLRHVDVTMTLTSTGVVIRGLPDRCLSILLPDCRKHVCRR